MEHNSGNDQQLNDRLEQWSAAELNGDTTALDALLAGDFVGIGPRGFMLPKAAWLQRYTGGELANTAFVLQQTQTRVYGDAAIITGSLGQQSTYQGHDASGQFRATLIWVRQQGRWLLAGLQLSPLAGPA